MMLFIWILAATLIPLAFYGFVLKKKIDYKAVRLFLIAASIPVLIAWYIIPTHIRIADIEGVHANVQLHEDRLRFSFADVDGRLYRIEDPGKIEAYLLNLKKHM